MKQIISLIYILIISSVLLLSACKSTHGGPGGCPGAGGYSTDNNTQVTSIVHT